MKKLLIVSSLALLASTGLFAQKQVKAIIKGVIIEKLSDKPLEFANVILKNNKDTTQVQGAITDKNGLFEFDNLPFGQYKISYTFIGFDKMEYPFIIVDSKQTKIDLGKLYISEVTKILGEVEVTARKLTFVNSIDRKTFNVGEDLMSKTGSVSDLMQNIPSVQVDIDGNVSLRGSENVMILINGKPSTLMGTNRAAVLQQMPASSIDKIEIITNPSAKYKPDGTSGIINIVLKKNKKLGFNGTISTNAGNDERYNGSIMANYNPGKLNIFGSYSIRQDDRLRYTYDSRKRTNIEKDSVSYSRLNSTDHSRPVSNILQTGVDYNLNDHTKVGVSGSYNYRRFDRRSTDLNTYLNSDLTVTREYDRLRRDPEFEKDMEFNGSVQHTFAKEGHELNLDYTASKSREEEDNHYSNIYRIPASSPTFDNTLIKQGDDESQLSLEYTNPISEDIKIELGYILENRKNDMDFFGESFNSQLTIWEKDTEKTNRFIYKENIHVLYVTYEQVLGKFGFLGGIRPEQTFVNSNQLTTDTVIKSQYFRLYPSLHMSYNLSDLHQLQLNYSHRIRRPEGDEMNPFPEYQDQYNLRIGNPHLKPADIHSVELGYQFKKKRTSFLSTVYYRYTYNSMTDIIRYINDSVKLTTRENLSKSTSAGLELVLSTSIGNFANVNLSTNTYYNIIDASTLGYSSSKSTIAWSANLSAGINITKSTVLQLTTSYMAERLTPQGRQLPTYLFNAGYKQEFLKKKVAFIITVSDIFNSMRNTTIIDTPELYEKIIRRRSARMIYAGFTYTFGNQKKSEKNNSLKFDNQL